MAQGEKGMPPDHTRSGVAHDGTDPLPHRGLIAVDRAVRTGGFLRAETASFHPFLRVMAEIAAVAAEQLPSVVAAAEHADHEADSPDLPPDAGRTVQHPAGCRSGQIS